MNYGCNGRSAVISGGTSGIGLAAARTLLADGAEVWLLARTERPQLLAELKTSYGEKVHFIQCDVANVASCKAAAAQIKNAGSVDFLVNSAGIYREQSMEMLTESEFDEIFGVNVKGTVFLTQALLPYMAAAPALKTPYLLRSRQKFHQTRSPSAFPCSARGKCLHCLPKNQRCRHFLSAPPQLCSWQHLQHHIV